MTELYFVRHGETEINTYRAFNGGGSDSPLTAAGRAAVKATGRFLAHLRFGCVISSSMPRALTTAGLIMAENEWQVPIASADGLKEMRFGDWEGRPVQSIDRPHALDAYFTDPLVFDAEVAAQIHAERYVSVARRTRAVIETVTAAQPAGRVLIVAHGVVLLVLLHVLAGGELATLRDERVPANASVSRVDTTVDGRYRVVYRNRLT